VIEELVTNACQAMPGGGTVHVRVGTRPAETPSDAAQVTLEVTDTGPGATPDVLARMFDPFFTTRGVTHAGLGLAAVRGVVTVHGGHARAAAAPGGGLTVAVVLPSTGSADA
jgi:signal transduction histidine kinase